MTTDDGKIIDEVLGVPGVYVVSCWSVEAKAERMEAKARKQSRALRRLTFCMWLEFACILFLSIGVGILAGR